MFKNIWCLFTWMKVWLCKIIIAIIEHLLNHSLSIFIIPHNNAISQMLFTSLFTNDKIGRQASYISFIKDFAGVTPLLSTIEYGYGKIWVKYDLIPLKGVFIFLPDSQRIIYFWKSSKIQWDMSQRSFYISFRKILCVLSVCRLKCSFTYVKFPWILLWICFVLFHFFHSPSYGHAEYHLSFMSIILSQISFYLFNFHFTLLTFLNLVLKSLTVLSLLAPLCPLFVLGV